MTDTRRIAAAIKATYPHLSDAHCLRQAAQLVEALDHALNAGWDLGTMELVPQYGRTTELSMALKQLRLNSGISRQEVARQTEWSTQKIMRIENGGTGISITDLRALFRAYNVTDPRLIAHLENLARGLRRPPR